jgi:hypothetical protein
MKISDIIRKLADQIEAATEEDRPENSQPHAELHDIENSQAGEGDDINVQSMTPPLQQKLELLKKATGVPSMYDDEDGHKEPHDELDDIKQIAGIKPVVLHIASDTDPFGE